MEVKEYYAVRNAIQLKSTTVKKINVEKFDKFDEVSGKIKTKIGIGSSILAASENNIRTGICKINIEMFNESKNEAILIISLIVSGNFVNEGHLEENSFSRGVDDLCVPLLYPTIKANISLITSLLNIPPLDIPTLDILHSIDRNKA